MTICRWSHNEIVFSDCRWNSKSGLLGDCSAIEYPSLKICITLQFLSIF